MAKIECWYEVYNPETGEMEKFRDPLNPDRFPEDNKEQTVAESEESQPN